MRCYSGIVLILLFISAPAKAQECSKGWYVTGYFLPYEGDYRRQQVLINLAGRKIALKSDFLEETKVEGWGKTQDGLYIGYWNEEWHLGQGAHGDHNNILSTNPHTNSIATDQRIIPSGTLITIPTLPEGYGERMYVVDDVGPAIVGKHIDVYTGFGNPAKDIALAITGENNIVCIK